MKHELSIISSLLMQISVKLVQINDIVNKNSEILLSQQVNMIDDNDDNDDNRSINFTNENADVNIIIDSNNDDFEMMNLADTDNNNNYHNNDTVSVSVPQEVQTTTINHKIFTKALIDIFDEEKTGKDTVEGTLASCVVGIGYIINDTSI